ncbi:MAG: ABC transporter substrate-binding protein [Clostridia bacterium]|nr:ABC transporter substrate-binding protein [Clostridia bacterium]
MKATYKIISTILLSLILLSSFVSCKTKNNNIGTADKETVTVIDHLGYKVTVPKNIDRIVIGKIYPLPSVVSIFFDSAEKIVGMPQQCMTAAKNSILSELYPEILNAETDYINGANLNIEALIELDPDVYIYNAADPGHGELCRKAGIPAVAVAVNKWDYDAVLTLENWIDLLSQIFPENKKSDIVSAYSENVINIVNDRIKNADNFERENIFFLYQYTDTMIATSGNKFFGQWWSDAVYANNVGSAIDKDNSVNVNMEQIYQWNPECILITNFTTATPETLYNDPKWSGIDAVKNKRVYKMPLGMYRSYTCGVDTPVTLLWIAKTVYPDVFEDIDIIEETKKYYKEVFGVELTAKQAETIFSPSSNASAYQ